MNEVTKTTTQLPGALPDDYADKLLAGVAASRSTMSTGGSQVDLLKLGRNDGVWTYGQSNEEVQQGSRWIVNPMMFAHGWVCWIQGTQGVKGRKGGELMRSMAEPYPEQPPLVEGKHPWAQQYACVMKCMEGVDEGMEVLYKGSSMGGTEGMAALIDAFQRNFAIDRAHPCPVVTLESTWYDNKTYGGKTYKPVFKVLGFADMNGALAGQAAPAVAPPTEAPAAAPAAAPAPARVRKPPLAATQAPAAAPPVEEPVPTARTHVGQRRRPVAR